MNNLEQRISDLELENDDLKLEIHAIRVAMTVLSTAFNGVAGQQGMLADAFKKGMESKGRVEFTFKTSEDYQDKLTAKILELL